MASRIDLHTHTTASDGTLPPAELLERAVERGVEVLSITDHDTTAGHDAAVPLLSRYPSLRLIPGIEINAEGEPTCHLLGYFIDPAHSGLQQKLSLFRDARRQRAIAMVEKLNTLGVPVK